MARPRSETKRALILEAALLEFAENGLAASTAGIAARAEVATGTLFTYFATKKDLQNALYLELKREVYGRMNDGFPLHGSLAARLGHIWLRSLEWASGLPARRKVSMQLRLSDVLTPATRKAADAMSGPLGEALVELEGRAAARGLPAGFAGAAMSSLQDATLSLLGGRPKRTREELMRQSFEAFWRMVR